MKKLVVALLSVYGFLCLSGCGSNGGASPDFSVAALPTFVTLTNGGGAQSLIVTVSPANGFSGPVQVALTGMSAGITASPSSVSVMPGQLQQILLTASGAAVTSTGSLTLTGTAGATTHTVPVGLVVGAAAPVVTSATLSATAFSFGNDLVGTTLTKPVVTVVNTGSAALTLNPTLTGDASYSIIATAQGCGTTLAAGASCAVTVAYAPAVASGTTGQATTLNLGMSDVPAGTVQTVAISGVSAALLQGAVASTHNPQVALYTWTLPFPGTMTVSFGPDTTYGLQTWSQTTTGNGQTVSMFVAGMKGNSTYHMQATAGFDGGLTATDTDHTFQTGAPLVQPQLTATTTPGMVPQSGVEELTGLTGAATGLSVSDLQGNVLWSYLLAATAPQVTIQGAKLLPDGNFLVSFGSGSSEAIAGPPSAGVNVAVREINLAGDIVREISLLDLNSELTEAGYDFQLLTFHHDVTPLPNGHWLVLGNTTRQFTDLTGYPGVTTVLGDVVVDLDTNLEPVWVWNEFDHFDVNRHPMNFPDWTHTNAITYSKDDGNLLVSMRHQNRVVKVDYKDGAGAGDVLWRLGEGGDFTLGGGTDPTDWQYAQHYPSIASAKTSGVFSLVLMDNGNDRAFPAGMTCGTTGAPPCLYSTVPIFQIDETAKTATIVFHQIAPTSMYSNFGGSADVLANGNVEYDLCGVGGVGGTSDIFEVTQTSTPVTVWHMSSNSGNMYRGYRIPSLYPGVQW